MRRALLFFSTKSVTLAVKVEDDDDVAAPAAVAVAEESCWLTVFAVASAYPPDMVYRVWVYWVCLVLQDYLNCTSAARTE